MEPRADCGDVTTRSVIETLQVGLKLVVGWHILPESSMSTALTTLSHLVRNADPATALELAVRPRQALDSFRNQLGADHYALLRTLPDGAVSSAVIAALAPPTEQTDAFGVGVGSQLVPTTLSRGYCGADVLRITYALGNTVKLFQLTGDTDVYAKVSVPGQSASRAGIRGTDLGISTQVGSELFFFFGDSATCARCEQFGAMDSVARMPASMDPDGSLEPWLTWNLDANEECFQPIQFVHAPSDVTYGPFSVPTGAFASSPTDSDSPLYLFYLAEQPRNRTDHHAGQHPR